MARGPCVSTNLPRIVHHRKEVNNKRRIKSLKDPRGARDGKGLPSGKFPYYRVTGKLGANSVRETYIPRRGGRDEPPKKDNESQVRGR